MRHSFRKSDPVSESHLCGAGHIFRMRPGFRKCAVYRVHSSAQFVTTHVASCCTRCHQGELAVLLHEPIGCCGHESAASGAEWMSQRERSAPQIQPINGQLSHLQIHEQILTPVTALPRRL